MRWEHPSLCHGLVALLSVAAVLLVPVPAHAAGCFFKGAGSTYNWSDTSVWKSTSGGAGACAATGGYPHSAADTATLDGNSGGGTLTMDADITITSITANTFAGALNFSSRTVALNTFSSSGTSTRTIAFGTSTLNLAGTGTVLTVGVATGLTITNTSATINVTDASSTGKTFNTGSTNPPSWSNVNLTFSGSGSGTYTFNGLGTGIGTVTISNTGAAVFVMSGAGKTMAALAFSGYTGTVQFTNGSTNTISALNAVGSAGNTITFQSATPGLAWNIINSGTAASVTADYLIVSDSHATPGSKFPAGAHSKDAGNNGGWDFSTNRRPLGLALVANAEQPNGGAR